MLNTDITQEAFVSKIEVKLNVDYTEEQQALIKNFGDGPTFCFADPGTGKTSSSIGGLINAELFKGINGENIYACSFTRLATAELAIRHQHACERLGITRRVNFQTLHALCRSILKENYRKLGLHKFDSSAALTMESAYNIIEGSLDEWGLMLPPAKIKSVVRACNSLNAALIFDEDVVASKMAYKECDIDYELFDRIRGLLFSYSLLQETISVSDLLLYTVMLLQRYPEISQKYKSKCKLLLMDEAQDLSLLQLRVISLLTDNPVFVGDMKQQIYGFNGACQEVVAEFHKLYPSAVDMQLTQSFRCRNEIADYATKIILYNKIGGETYKGVGPGGHINVINGLFEDGLDIASLAARFREEYVTNQNKFKKEYLFLTRNNISQIPIMEELYKNGLPFRTNSYTPAYEVPVIKELCELMLIAQTPTDPKNAYALRYLIPELREFGFEDNPIYKICLTTGMSIFEINYQYRDAYTANEAMQALIQVSNMLKDGSNVGDMWNVLWPTYNKNWLKATSWKLENEPDFYTKSVSTLTHKTFTAFMKDELAKQNIIDESEKYRRGIRCYTMHASKGLEADVVYILAANDGIIPNNSKIQKMINAGCLMDAARAIREERSLCYVACTRAREELNIIYDGAVSPILVGNNPYTQLDAVYDGYRQIGDDIAAFTKFTDRYVEYNDDEQ